MDTPVPFNFLQPVIENAFRHGFHDDPVKTIGVIFRQEKGNIVRIAVRNSGKMLTEQEYYSISQAVRSGTVHGLSMVWRKLSLFYGDKCAFSIREGESEGSVAEISFPLKT